NTAQAMNAYTMSDRGTWISFENRGNLEILVEGDERLFNPYHVMLVNPDKCDNVKVDAAREFMNWLVSEEGQQLIADYRMEGKQLFVPDAL
ncbi:MAG TPA: substrate-binding domain-containing protein, partial [Salinisphaeraceae bacterium]|nr:substrate-binding domain-containing protein [Salinisphaeraceae bacterium]